MEISQESGWLATRIELIRSAEGENGGQIENVRRWQKARNSLMPRGETGHGLGYLQQTARDRKNVFAALMEAVQTHSLGRISHEFYDVGGEYRRNM